MRSYPAAFFLLLRYFVSNNAESCTEDTDCSGYSENNGVRCINNKCETCSPVLTVSGLGQPVSEVCIFDHYTETTSFTARIEGTGDDCTGVTWTILTSEWTGYRISKENNFEILEDNLLAKTITSDDATLEAENFSEYGLFAVKAKINHRNSYGIDGSSELTGYFARSCAFSYEETWDKRYKLYRPECRTTSDQISDFGYRYSYELPKCSVTEASGQEAATSTTTPTTSITAPTASTTTPTSSTPLPTTLTAQPTESSTSTSQSTTSTESSLLKSTKATLPVTSVVTSTEAAKAAQPGRKEEACSLNILCPVSCSSLMNPQEELTLTIDIGCPAEIGVIHLGVRNCPTNNTNTCIPDEDLRDISVYNSVKYKPKPTDLSWNYHGLFVSVHLTIGISLEGSVLVKYGPVPEAGSCSIVPESGYALTTQFNITCSGFTIADSLELKYSLFTHHEQDYTKASKIYTGLSPSRFGMLLQPGREVNDYKIYVWVKAFVYYGAYVTVVAQTQVYPPSHTGDVDIVDLAESFVAVDAGKNSSLIEDLISVGNTDEATQLLGVITASLNLDVKNDTKSDADTAKKAKVRTAIVTVLTEIPVTDFEAVSSTIGILNEATQVREEISEEAQDVATELYSNLAEGFDQFVEQRTTEEVKDTAGSILDGVTRILDMNTDTGVSQMKKINATTDAEAAEESTEKVEKARNSTLKLLKTIDSVSNTMMQRQQTGANATVFKTDTMTVGIQKLPSYGLSNSSYSASGASNSSGSFKFPDVSQKLDSGQNYGVKMLYINKNPYVWDATAGDVTSPVISLSLKNANNTPVVVKDLEEPVAISLSNFGQEKSSTSTFQVTIKKNRENLTDINPSNLTVDTSTPNMLSFNISAVPEKTASLEIVPLSNISSFKILIKSDGKPTYNEIIQEGFLYPDDIQYSDFANFEYFKNIYLPSSSEKGRIYLTSNSSLSRTNFSGTYYIGLALDLTHTETLETLQRDYPACLGSDKLDCVETVEVTIDIQTKQLGCLYWDEGNETWSSLGCEISPHTTRDTIECVCTHMTSFSGSILVLPNFVDPIGDVKLFLTFFDNPVVVTAVIIVWVIYFFLIHWARQADKKDKEKVGVISCSDNSPTNHYLYLVCVVTGWWKDAGTSANVFLFLKGSKGTSSSHCLSSTGRPCFQTGSEDWFLVTTEQSLGDLLEVTLWHDNMGANPHWYLNHVLVKDLQLRKSWHFIYNNWLAVDRGSLLRTSTTLEAVTEEEIKFKQKHNFTVKTTNDFRDGHLWLSIFSKPAKSTFTRVQRLTCALSLLLTTMLTNIMFYGIPTDDPDDQVGTAGGIVISLSAIVIGIESSLIMFPINLLILQLFMKVKPKPKRKAANIFSNNHSDLQKIIDTSFEITDVVMRGLTEKVVKPLSEVDVKMSESGSGRKTELMLTKGSSSSSSLSSQSSFVTADQSPSVQSLASEEYYKQETPPNQKKDSKLLPWWFLYIAWFLFITVSLVSSYFVMLYGLKYGYNKSVSWLVSFLTGFTQSACITQPLKVICIAVIITLIFKKPAEFEDFDSDTELDEDEVYLHEVSGPDEIHHPTIQPLSKKLLTQIRERLHLEWLMDMTIRDIVLYVIYIAVVTFMVHGHRDVKLAYRNNVAIEDVLVNPGCIKLHKCFFLAKADTVERMFQYLEEVLIPNLADMSVADHDYTTPGSNHFLLGPFRLRQQRIQKGTCQRTQSSVLKRFGQDLPECVGSYWVGDEDTGSYNNSWKKPLSPSASEDGPWSYQSTWKLKTVPYSGIHATYSGGGFVLEMLSNIDQLNLLNSIKNTDWIDDRTRAIFAEFTLYNPNADLFSVVMIFFELTEVGGVFPNHQIFTAKLYHYSTDIGPYIAICEVLFLLFNIAFTYIEIKRYRKLGRKEYFQDIWSFAEILQLAVAYTVVGLFFQRMVSASDILEQYRESHGQKFVSFYTAIAWDFVLGYVVAFQVAYITLKSVKLLRFNKRTFMILDTITFSRSNLLSFAFMFIVFMIAFGHFTYLAFGSILYGYKSFGISLFTMLNFALGASDLPSMYEANRILGPAYFAIFVFFSQWCFLTIFVAILNFAINDSKAMTEQRKSKFELVDYVVGKVKSIV